LGVVASSIFSLTDSKDDLEARIQPWTLPWTSELPTSVNSDSTIITKASSKARKEEDKRVCSHSDVSNAVSKERKEEDKKAKKAACTKMFEQILQKQQEVSCKKCEAKDDEIKQLKSSLEAKKRIIEDLEADQDDLVKRVKMSHDTGSY